MKPKYKSKLNPLDHTYEYGGVMMPGVNEVLNNIGIRSSVDSSFTSISGVEFLENYKTERDFGTEVHKIAHALVLGKRVLQCSGNLLPYITGIENFLSDYPWAKKSICETPICCPQIKLAGTADLVSFHDGAFILDWKSSDSVSKTWALTMNAYAYLVKQNYKAGRKAFTLWCVMLGEKFFRRYKIHAIPHNDVTWFKYKSLLNIYNNFRG